MHTISLLYILFLYKYDSLQCFHNMTELKSNRCKSIYDLLVQKEFK